MGSLVDAHPPLPEQEQSFAAILRGVEDITRLEVNIGKLAVEPFYFLAREWLEDIYQGEKPYPLYSIFCNSRFCKRQTLSPFSPPKVALREDQDFIGFFYCTSQRAKLHLLAHITTYFG